MKRIVVFLICAVLILCGCSKAPTSNVSLPTNFATETVITVEDTVYNAILSRYADGYWKIELLAPMAVKGLIFTVSGENTEVSFDGLRFTFDTARFPVGSVVTAAISYLDRLIASPIDVIKGEEQCLATGTINEEAYTLTLSKTNVPQKLELADSGMTIEFTTFDIVEFVEQ